MADKMTATPDLGADDDQATDDAVGADTDQSSEDSAEKHPLGFMQFAQKFVESDPRIQALRDAPEPTAEQHTDLRMTAMEIQQNIRYAQDDFKRLNPDASEVQVEEYVAAVFERDIVTADRIQKEIERKRQEKEQAEANDKKKSVALNTTDTAQNGGAKEDRFTGQNTMTGIRRMLFGNS
ncbi:hypothetical protein F4X33_03180 [Candidatus Poribacteria bacterium]|nr:hypothetical protein [Candidatus Poribacteria bacterium]